MSIAFDFVHISPLRCMVYTVIIIQTTLKLYCASVFMKFIVHGKDLES